MDFLLLIIIFTVLRMDAIKKIDYPVSKYAYLGGGLLCFLHSPLTEGYINFIDCIFAITFFIFLKRRKDMFSKSQAEKLNCTQHASQ